MAKKETKSTKKTTTKGKTVEEKHRCGRPTKSGEPCQRVVKNTGDACHIHKDVEEVKEEIKVLTTEEPIEELVEEEVYIEEEDLDFDFEPEFEEVEE